MKKNIPIISKIKTHPDYELFCQLNSPLNFLSRDPQTNSFLEGKNLLSHYSQSQTAFAHHSMSALINLMRNFNPNKTFDLEEFYRFITSSRVAININTADSFEKFNDLQKQNLTNTNLHNLNPLSYLPSDSQPNTHTILSESSKYSKYNEVDEDYFGALQLSYFVKLLGEEPTPEDSLITLGNIEREDSGRVVHSIGTYRIDRPQQEINRVDQITALALKKVFTTQDQDEALKYAFIFGALRGYNVRSATGACWAQEMSMRWIFAQKGWPQFCKMPGIYLDIEATMLDCDNPQEQLQNLIQKEVSDYKRSIAPEQQLEANSLFDHPAAQKENDFIRYLIETRKYRAEDLPEIISYRGDNEKEKTALHIAAKNGDKQFFEMLTKSFEQDPDIKRQVRLADWDAVISNAENYGNPFLVEEIRDCETCANKFDSQTEQVPSASIFNKLFSSIRGLGLEATLFLLPNQSVLKNWIDKSESEKLKGSLRDVEEEDSKIVSDSDSEAKNNLLPATKVGGVKVEEASSLKAIKDEKDFSKI